MLKKKKRDMKAIKKAKNVLRLIHHLAEKEATHTTAEQF